jgi:hypothetical protein
MASSVAARCASTCRSYDGPRTQHHLALHNDYVKVFNVEVSPGDSIVLHSHDQDTVAIAIGEQLVTVGIPGKPDVHRKMPMPRFGSSARATCIPRTSMGTLLITRLRWSSCTRRPTFTMSAAEILPGQPLLESDQTRMRMVRVPPHQAAGLEEVSESKDVPQLIIAIDAASISTESAKGPAVALQPGDYFWIDRAFGGGHIYRNARDKESRFIQIVFSHEE